jgi:DNA topoisomerase-1
MEEDLDRIARGEVDRLTVMREFYGPFKARVEQAMAGAAAERQPAARAAPKSGQGKRSRTAKPLPKSEKEGQVCPQCHEGTLQVKSGKFGAFLGCSRYALGCQYTENIPGTGSRKKRWPRRKRKSYLFTFILPPSGAEILPRF